MENFESPDQEPGLDIDPAAGESNTTYPPKYVKDVQAKKIWLRSIVSLAIYLLLGIIFLRNGRSFY